MLTEVAMEGDTVRRDKKPSKSREECATDREIGKGLCKTLYRSHRETVVKCEKK